MSDFNDLSLSSRKQYLFAVFVLQKLIDSGSISSLNDFDPFSLDTSLLQLFDFKNSLISFKNKNNKNNKNKNNKNNNNNKISTKIIQTISSSDLDTHSTYDYDPIHHIVQQYYFNFNHTTTT
jgi:hypothetical protein